MNIEDLGYSPIIKMEDFYNINEDDCVNGYLLGLNGGVVNYNVSRSFQHGYLNGLNDGGFRKADHSQRLLIQELLKEGVFLTQLFKDIQIFKNTISEEEEKTKLKYFN